MFSLVRNIEGNWDSHHQSDPQNPCHWATPIELNCWSPALVIVVGMGKKTLHQLPSASANCGHLFIPKKKTSQKECSLQTTIFQGRGVSFRGCNPPTLWLAAGCWNPGPCKWGPAEPAQQSCEPRKIHWRPRLCRLWIRGPGTEPRTPKNKQSTKIVAVENGFFETL